MCMVKLYEHECTQFCLYNHLGCSVSAKRNYIQLIVVFKQLYKTSGLWGFATGLEYIICIVLV